MTIEEKLFEVTNVGKNFNAVIKDLEKLQKDKIIEDGVTDTVKVMQDFNALLRSAYKGLVSEWGEEQWKEKMAGGKKAAGKSASKAKGA